MSCERISRGGPARLRHTDKEEDDMGSYSDVSTDELIEAWKDTAQERASMLEDNRDEDDQDHYDGLGDQLDEIADELIDGGVKDW